MSQYTARIEPRRSSVRTQAAAAATTSTVTVPTQNGRAAYRSRVPAYGNLIEQSQIIVDSDTTLR
jgi:hypothetical protein